ESIDSVRAGYPDITSFDDGWKAGTDTLAVRLRQRCGPSRVLVGNCATSTKYAWFNGWMRENFPYQNGGTWYSNMTKDPGGYFSDDRSYLGPTHDYLSSVASPPSDPYSSSN